MNTLTIDVNGYCNLGCEFCYQNLDGSELSEEEILKILDKNPNFADIEIGGGEPFLHKDIISIIKSMREKGKKLHISTNATRIPEGFLELEDRLRQGSQVQVSLHASNPELYKKITKKDLFNAVIDNIGKIKPRYSTLISSAIYQANFDDVPNIVDLSSELELPLRVSLVFPVGNGKNVDLLTAKQIGDLKSYLLFKKIEGNMIDSPIIHENNCVALQNFYGIVKRGICPADSGKLYVSPAGEEYNCEFLRG